jgi:hypothetical protein
VRLLTDELLAREWMEEAVRRQSWSRQPEQRSRGRAGGVTYGSARGF